MGTIHPPEAVKLFMGLISSSRAHIEETETALAGAWGTIDEKSDLIPFDFTSYYEPEMGKNLLRRWVSFERLIQPDGLAQIKCATNALEAESAAAGARKINIDPGYLALSKLVLASTKDFSHRIYLSGGIFAEITLLYKNKQFQALPWTYPDYSSAAGLEYFARVRAAYARRLRQT